jgi:pullulanase
MKALSRLLNLTLLSTLLLTALGPSPALADHTPDPTSVAIAGTIQSELGCAGDWMPACDSTFLAYDAEDDVWQGSFNVAPANDQDKNGSRYKAALNGDWTENYGLNAAQGGGDIPLVVTEPRTVKFYYDHKTHWATDDVNSPIVVAAGTFQTALGCALNNDPSCLRSWMQDPDGDGLYTFATTAIPAGGYTVELGINERDSESAAAPQSFKVKEDGDEIYFGYNPSNEEFSVSTEGAPRGSLAQARAHWVTRDTILWNVVGSPRYTYALVSAPEGGLKVTAGGVEGGIEIPLTFVSGGPGSDVFESFPNLIGYAAFKLAANDATNAAELLKGQVAVISRDDTGKVVDATGLQTPGVLDDIYHYDGPLGATWENNVPTLRLWAPTAHAVAIQLFETSSASSPDVSPLTFEESTGVWSITGTTDWKNKFYLYQVEVLVPGTGAVETNLVTDPYSFSLSMNSERSQLVDLNDPDLMPDGWEGVQKPPLAAPEDSVIYELHIRDFSISDTTVPEELRGTYKAFTKTQSNGMKHLAALAKAGLTHIHLLPAFDIATIQEDRALWETVPDETLAALPPDSQDQKNLLAPYRDLDGFNWGYDPYHYTVPEGSYATDPNSSTRILEFRQMVQALNEAGLRVVMDVVYNHTNASGQDPRSVLDKIVPGYYYRLTADGNVETSTCCENTATEHTMMEKLMIDSVLTWATAYKVDGFRFDLMGHHMRANMVNLRNQLDALTPAADGLDGKAIYVYGEGWDFGEVANNSRGVNAAQLNIGGTGIGVFNDRLRDGVRGGNPFDPPVIQGFTTGLFLAPNSYESRPPAAQLATLLDYTDWIKAGLAGNLASYQFTTARGEFTTADRIFYGGVPVGYTSDPQENIVYVSAHDNETIFDAVQLKAPETASLADRVRINNLALDIAMLSQGVPFFHAGDDLLRSKSLDRNSYNSGDWFNKLDFSMQTSNFGVGLPAEGEGNYGYMQPLLASAALKPAPADIQFAASHFQTLLNVRQSSPLFKLQTAEQVQRSLTFLNAGPDQVPGLIVMQLTDIDALDPNLDALIVFFNASPTSAAFADPSLIGLTLEPYAPYVTNNADTALTEAGFDPATGAFTLPARSTVIYAIAESGAYQAATATAQPATAAPTATLTPTVAASATHLLAATATLVATPVTGPGGQSINTLNIVAVAVAILGALGAFYLIRSRQSGPEPEEAPPSTPTKKLSRTQRRKNRK